MRLSTHSSKISKYSATKAERLEARISPDQKHLFQHAADLLGRTLTDFVVSTLQQAATRVIQEQEMLHLSLADRKVFVEALLNPPKPNNRLLKATKRYQKEVSF